MKKKALCFSVIIFMLTITSCSQEKYVGSKHTEGFSLNMEIYDSVEKMTSTSDLIVIASYSAPPTEYYEKDDETGFELYSTRYILHIEKVLKGDLEEGNEILFSQMGKPGIDEYETKIKQDKKYILFLAQKTLTDEAVYDANGIEQGILEINENNRLYSYFDEGVMPEYDGEKLSKLEAEINKKL